MRRVAATKLGDETQDRTGSASAEDRQGPKLGAKAVHDDTVKKDAQWRHDEGVQALHCTASYYDPPPRAPPGKGGPNFTAKTHQKTDGANYAPPSSGLIGAALPESALEGRFLDLSLRVLCRFMGTRGNPRVAAAVVLCGGEH